MLELIEKLEALEAKATKAPWVDASRTGGDFAGLIVHGSRKAGAQVQICYMAHGDGTPDHTLIAAARNALPALLKAARRGHELEGEVVGLRVALDEISKCNRNERCADCQAIAKAARDPASTK